MRRTSVLALSALALLLLGGCNRGPDLRGIPTPKPPPGYSPPPAKSPSGSGANVPVLPKPKK